MKLESIAVFAGIVSTALAGVYHKPPPATTYWTTIYAPSTSVVTVTSCSKGGCGTQSYATGVTKTKTVHEGVTTEYTTYCPLTTSHEVVKSTCSDTLVVWSTRSFSRFGHSQNQTDVAKVLPPLNYCSNRCPYYCYCYSICFYYLHHWNQNQMVVGYKDY